MNEQVRNYLLIGVAALTVLNTVLILTGDSDNGRVIDTPNRQTAIVEPSQNMQDQAQVQFNEQMNQNSAAREAEPVKPAKPAGPPTDVAFKQMAHDFGNIKQNSENKHIFQFTNTGQNPLIIQDAKGSCGCTVPKYPKQPIPPGESGEIEVVYKPGSQRGQQTKTVTLTANTDPVQTVLKITAVVEEEQQQQQVQ